ncbi:MAG: DNA mismatch repair protein MutT [Rhodospirillaceae bacterium]|nr:DNA mismatch repair protein MutT [Rhodospirillaceae bacterium]|tara:strand:- start:872 stop:1636 length:765 start_codon:yes stop_codon:yes gene_type:complete
MDTLEFDTNPFGGVLTNPAHLPENAAEFDALLNHSLDAWSRDGYKVVWFEAPIEKADLIPVAVNHSFTFHHCSENYVMLTRRLERDAFIPPYATHYTGAGGVCINEKNELLVVSERYRRNSKSPSYKLPGGALHQGEHLAECVTREVYEETGVKAEFVSLVCFRHWHGYRYGKSDIYFVCRLKPLSEAIAIQEDEIAEALWMPVEKYLEAEGVSAFNKEIVKAAIESPGVSPMEIDGYSDPERHEIFMPRYQQK